MENRNFAQWRQYVQALGVGDQSPTGALSNVAKQAQQIQGFAPALMSRIPGFFAPGSNPAINRNGLMSLFSGAARNGVNRVASERLPSQGSPMRLWTDILGQARRYQI